MGQDGVGKTGREETWTLVRWSTVQHLVLTQDAMRYWFIFKTIKRRELTDSRHFSHYIELYVISIENVVKEAELIAERRQQIMRCDRHDQSFDILG